MASSSGCQAATCGAPLSSPAIEKGDYVTIGESTLTWRVQHEPRVERRSGRFVFDEKLVVDLQSGQSARWRHSVPVSNLTLYQKGDSPE